MEFGVLYDLRNPRWSGLTDAQVYAETLEHIAACEAMGFDVVWLTEHHFIDDAYLPAVLPFAAAVAARTTRVTIGTAVLLLPLHDALRVAEDAAVVDVLSGGRLRLGVGLGYKLEEFAAFGVRRQDRPSLLEEGIEVIRRAWADGPASFHGRHYRFDAIDVTPKPVQRPGPEIWLAGRDPVPVRRAARLGDGLIAVTGEHIYREYLAARAEAGRTGPANLCTFAFTLPADDPERAQAELGRFAEYRISLYNEWYGTAGDLEIDRRLLDRQRSGQPVTTRSLFATPETVRAELDAYRAAGVTSVLWFATLPGTRPSATLPYLETLAGLR